jgi:hypothetical protein
MNTKKSRSKKEVAQPETIESVIEEMTVAVAPEQIVEAAQIEEKSSAKKSKAPKTKVIRDSFSFPEHDYRMISDLKKSCLASGIHVKKSEILRAGLHLLTAANPDELKKAIESVDKVRTGRPSATTD